MLTRCSNCQTQFSLDDRQVGPDGAAVRCSVCSYVFRVGSSKEVESPPWQIRTIEDQLFTAPDLAALREWIAEGRLHPDDQVSRTGQTWVRLREMPEFSDAFSGFSDLPPLFSPVDGEVEDGQVVGPPPDFRQSDPMEDSVELLGSGEFDLIESGRRPAVEAEPEASEPEADAPRGPNPDAVDTVVARPMGRRTSAPRPADEVIPRPRSMLDVVSHRAVADDAGVARPVGRKTLDEPRRAVDPPPATPAVEESLTPPRRRSAWPVVAGLVLLSGLAVAVGVPQVRERVMGLWGGGTESSQEAASTVELQAAQHAIGLGAPAALTQAEDTLRERMKMASDEELVRLELARVDVLTTRALASAMWAFIDPSIADKLQVDVQDDADRAAQLFAHPDLARLPTTDIEEARARLRLVQGREPELILRRYPEDADPELRLLVTGAPIWRSRTHPVPGGLIAGLRQLSEPSVLARVLLGIAYLRSGDEEGARNTVEALVEEYPDHPVVDAFGDRLDAMAEAEQVAVSGVEAPEDGQVTPAEEAAQTGGAEEEPEQSPPEPEDPDVDQGTQPESDEPEDDSGGGQMGIDRMIDVGCSRVESGRVREGLELLIKAHDRRPHDVDVLICMGEAHMRLGNYGTALRQFERALDRSPRIGSALRGAAKAARKSGSKDKALSYYRRVLEIEPRNAEARAFVDEHDGAGSPEGENGSQSP